MMSFGWLLSISKVLVMPNLISHIPLIIETSHSINSCEILQFSNKEMIATFAWGH